MKYLTPEQVVEAHASLLKSYGGTAGGGHRGSAYEGVAAALGAVENAYYDNLHEIAAAYAVYIVQGHVFLDGNKRAASFAMLEFLHVNGARVSAPSKKIVSIMVKLQKRSESGEDTGSLIRWVADSLRSRKRRR